MYYEEINFKPEELLMHLRKSRSDDPTLTVEEVLAKHEAILDEWCEKNIGGLIPEENRFREVISGETIADRPEFQRLLKLIESPKYKAVLVVEVQRLSRGDLEDNGKIIKTFRYTDTKVITQLRTFDLRDDFDRDYFERELKRGNEFLEYTKKILNRGILLSVQKGNYVANIAPFGYDRTYVMDGKRRCPTLIENKEEADIVRMIFDMYVNKNYGFQKICIKLDALGIKSRNGKNWSEGTIEQMLRNIHYIGKVRWNYRKVVPQMRDSELIKTRPIQNIDDYLVYEGKHEAIIPKELFDAAQAKHGSNYRIKANATPKNALQGILHCECGYAMVYRICVVRGVQLRKPRLICKHQRNCKNSSCEYDELIDRVCDILEECIEDFKVKIQNSEDDSIKLHANLIKRLEKQLKELEKKEINQWEKYTEEGMPKHIFDTLNEKVLKEKHEIEQALCTAKNSMPEKVDYQEKLVRFKDALDALKDPNVDVLQKNKFLKACIENITYKREKSQRYNQTPIELDVKLRL